MKLANGLEKLEMLDINSIKHDPKNAKIHTEKQIQQLATSIEVDGLINAITIGYLDTKEDGVCIDGNGRLMAYEILNKKFPNKYKQIPVKYLQCKNKAQRTKIAIVLNAIQQETGFNKEIMEELLKDIEKIDKLEFENLQELELKSIDADIIEALKIATENTNDSVNMLDNIKSEERER